jgi:hypothetical protein
MFHVKQFAARLDLRLRRWLAHRLRRAGRAELDLIVAKRAKR